MSREQSVRSALRIALFAALVPVLMTGCIFSPEQNPPPDDQQGPKKVDSHDALIQNLVISYQKQDINLFTGLLANDKGNKAEYLFIPDDKANTGDDQWGYEEEIRVHQRMFEPQNTPVGQTPVVSELEHALVYA